MKTRTFMVMLALGLWFAPNVFAAEPVVVWDGGGDESLNFSSLTRTVGSVEYYFNLNEQNTKADDNTYVRIGGNNTKKAVTITASESGAFGTAGAVTVVMKFKDMPCSESNRGLIALMDGTTHQSDNGAQVGICSQGTRGLEIWNGYIRYDASRYDMYSSAEHTVAMTYSASNGTYTYLDGEVKLSDAALRSSYFTTPTGIILGGLDADNSSKFFAQTNMQIIAVAVFTSALSADEVSRYTFPSDDLSATISESTSIDQIPGWKDGASMKLTVTGDATLTIPAGTSVGVLDISIDDGKTLSLNNLGSVSTISSAGGTLEFPIDTTLPTDAAKFSCTSKIRIAETATLTSSYATLNKAKGAITGNGKLALSLAKDTTNIAGASDIAAWKLDDSENWRGTVELSGTCGQMKLSQFGNAESTVAINGLTSYAVAYGDGTLGAHDVKTLEIASGGWTFFGDYEDGKIVFPAALTGTGTFTCQTTGGCSVFFTGDFSGFQGAINLGDYTSQVQILRTDSPTDDPVTYSSYIAYAAGTVAVAEGSELDCATATAYGGFIVNGTLSATTAIMKDGANIGTVVSGSGLVEIPTLNYVSNSAQSAGNVFTATNSAWTGTVYVPPYTATDALIGFGLNLLGNENSTVALGGIDANGKRVYLTQTSIVPALRIDGAVAFTDGSSNTTTTFPLVSGTGDITMDYSVGAKNVTLSIPVLTNYFGTLNAKNSGKISVEKYYHVCDEEPDVGDKVLSFTEAPMEGYTATVTVGLASAVVNGATVSLALDKGEDGFYVSGAIKAGGKSYKSVGAALAAGATGMIEVTASTSDEVLNFGAGEFNLVLSQGVTVKAASITAAQGSILSLSLAEGATSATFAIPVGEGTILPRLDEGWLPAGVTLYAYGDFELCDTLFQFRDAGSWIKAPTSARIARIKTDYSDSTIVSRPVANEDMSTPVRIIAGRKLYWCGGAEGAWRAEANWAFEDGKPANDYPQNYNKDGDHVFITNTVVITSTGGLGNDSCAQHITLDADAVFTRSGETQLRGRVMDGTGTLIVSNAIIGSSSAVFAISNRVEFVADTTNYAYLNSGHTVSFYGDITGSGKLIANHSNVQNTGVRFYGDNSGFYGEFESTNYNSRDATYIDSAKSASANAIWRVSASNSKSTNDVFPSRDNVYKQFGAFIGTMWLNTGTKVEIGARSDTESTLYPRNHTSYDGYTIRKVGDNVLNLKYADSGSSKTKLKELEICGGTVKLERLMPSETIKFTGNGGTLYSLIYIVTENEVDTEIVPDVSPVLVGSTAPICFFADEGETYEWATAIAASNVGGLTKKGAGTLKLLQVPLYSGPTKVLEGELIVPVGTKLESLELGENAYVRIDMSGASGGEPIAFSSGLFTGNADHITVIGDASAYTKIVSDSGVVFKNEGKTYTWIGTTGGDWDDESNWQRPDGGTDGGVPGSADTVVFNYGYTTGVRLSSDVSVFSLEAKGDFAFSSASTYTLTVLGDATISGNLNVSSQGTLDVRGKLMCANGVGIVMTPASASDSIVNAHPDYTERLSIGNNSMSIGSLTGGGTICASADQTVTIASGTTNTFYGSLTGEMGLTKAGGGTLELQGPSSFKGGVAINEGTLKLGSILDTLSSSCRYKIAGDDTENCTFVDSSETKLATIKGSVGNGMSYEKGEYAELVSSDDYFDGKKVVLFNAGQYAPSSRSLSAIFVYQKNDVPESDEQLMFYKSGNNADYFFVNSSSQWRLYNNGTYRDWAIYSDGNRAQTFTAGKKSVVSIVKRFTSSDNRNDYIGTTFRGAVAEGWAFTKTLSLEERAAAEAYLMQKWGCDDAEDHQMLPKTAKVTMAAGTMLDLGGMPQTVASFEGQGKVQNGLLKTADGVVTVTGDLTIPAVAGTTYVITTDATALRLTGEEVENITVDASAVTGEKPVVITSPGWLTEESIVVSRPNLLRRGSKDGEFKLYRLGFMLMIR